MNENSLFAEEMHIFVAKLENYVLAKTRVGAKLIKTN